MIDDGTITRWDADSVTSSETVTRPGTSVIYTNINGTATACELYVNVNGAARPCELYVNDNGTARATFPTQ